MFIKNTQPNECLKNQKNMNNPKNDAASISPASQSDLKWKLEFNGFGRVMWWGKPVRKTYLGLSMEIKSDSCAYKNEALMCEELLKSFSLCTDLALRTLSWSDEVREGVTRYNKLCSKQYIAHTCLSVCMCDVSSMLLKQPFCNDLAQEYKLVKDYINTLRTFHGSGAWVGNLRTSDFGQ